MHNNFLLAAIALGLWGAVYTIYFVGAYPLKLWFARRLRSIGLKVKDPVAPRNRH